MAERRYYTITFAVDLEDEADKKQFEDNVHTSLTHLMVDELDIESSTST